MSKRKQTGSKSDDDLLKEARDRFKFAYEADSTQREEERDDLKFQIPANQWTAKAKEDRKGRPIVSVSQLDQPIQLMINQERSAKLGVNVHPLTDDANDETAEVIQGLYRAIERDSSAPQARSWAYARAVKCGRGYWRVNTTYDEAGANPFDQKIVIEQIYYQESVIWDPAATRADRSDAEYCFVETWLDEDAYKRQWGESRLGSASSMEIEAIETEAPGWTRMTAGKRVYRVVEYIYKEHEDETIAMVEATGQVIRASDAPDGIALVMDPRDPEKPLKRTRDKVTVWSCKVSGAEVLSREELNGHYIPIVTILGRELHPFDGERHVIGIINHAKDSQRFFNYSISTYLERMAMEPKAPFVGYSGQFEGFEEQWDQVNVKNFTRLEVNPVVDPITKQVLPLPQRVQIDLTGTSLAGNALSIARDMVQSSTAVYDATLGKQDQGRQSGKAIQALQNQADAVTSDFMQNLADAMEYEAKVVMDLMPVIYDRPGRIASIVKGEADETDLVMLNKPFVRHPSTGRPVGITMPAPGQPAPPPTAAVAPVATPPGPVGLAAMGAPPMGAPPVPTTAPPPPKHYDLTKGIYSTSITIGKSFQSRLDQASTEIGQLLQADPQLMPMIGDLYFRNRDFPYAHEIAERLAKVREKTMPGIGESDGDQLPPEQAQAQIEALKQQLQQAQQQLQAAGMQIQTDQAKQQAQVAIAQLKVQADLEIERMQNATKIEVARIQAAKAPADESAMSQEEQIALQVKIQSEQADRQHESIEKAKDRQHDVVMEDLKARHERQKQAQAAHAEQVGKATDMAHELFMRETEPKEPDEKAYPGNSD